VEASYKVQVFRLDRYIGSQALTAIVAEVLTTLFFIFYLVREVKSIRRLKKEYFKVRAFPELSVQLLLVRLLV